MLFSSLGLSDKILQAISEKGYTSPSPIQEKAIPAVLSGEDVMAAAQTGTGKTAGFTLPLLNMLEKGKPARANQVRALVLTPTRELAMQVAESVETYGKHLPLRSTVVFGGVKINPQMMALRKGVDILVATPGRLLDLYSQNAVKFDQLETFILDEADRMLFMGFITDVRKIIKLLPTKRQNLMFSATFSDDIKQLATGLMNDPIEVSVTPANTTANSVEQELYGIDQNKKSKLLIKLIKQNDWQQVLVFSRTKHGANRIARNLESKNITAAAIHGNKSQAARTKALSRFKDKSIRVLVATDIAARGLDIEQLPQVVNFDLPQVAEDYVHRIGRTGRAGAQGKAISFVNADEFNNLNDIEQLIQKHIPRVEDDEIKAEIALPPSKEIRPPKKKKPKKNKKQNSDNSANNNQRENTSTKQGDGPNHKTNKPNSRNPRRKGNSGTRSRSNGNSNNSGNAKSSLSSGNKQKSRAKTQ